jgi:hypothetical protein
MRPILKRLAACAGVVLLAMSTFLSAAALSGDVPVEWPAPPAEPAIRFAKAVAGAGDWGIASSMFGRLFEALAGKEDARFVRPTGVAAREGVLYVADPGAPALWILDAPQNRLTKVTQAGGEAFASPVAVVPGPKGSVFIADSVRKKIFKVDAAGNTIATIASPALERPAGLAFDPERQWLYVADSVGQRITVFGSDGAAIRSFGSAGSADGEFNAPTHIAYDGLGTIYVTDALNYRVQAFDRDGKFLWKMGRQGDGSGDFAAPKGVAADAAGRVFVVDALFDAVQMFERGGRLLVAFGEHGTAGGQLWLPGGIFVAGDEIFVADSYNRRIVVYRALPLRSGAANR